MPKLYAVMVVDDSAFMRKMISDLINEDPEFEVICTAVNGKDALKKLQMRRPDCITMDVEMPEMDGLQALKHIMRTDPLPVVMLSGKTGPGANATILALEAGAVDFVLKPSGSISLDLYKIKQKLLDKLRIAVRTKVERKLQLSAKARNAAPVGTDPITARPPGKQFRHLVAIGTSTGGPKALQEVLTALPENFPAPVLVVQHMPPNFTKSLAVRLDQLSAMRIKEAEQGESLEAGNAYIAPGGWHMRLARKNTGQYTISLGKEELVNGHRPSVDALFGSLVPFSELTRHAVIMTGMGSDGAKGMKALQQSGAATTIAESEQTAVVYGMPRAAVELGCVTEIVPLHEIAATLINKVCKAE